MRKLLLAFVATVAIAGGILPHASFAQTTNPAFSQTGLLTSASSPPIVATPLSPPATCTLIVSGTFVGTVTFDESADGGQTYPTILGTATAAGTQVFSCNGYYTFRARFTAYTSGAAQVNITTASVGSGSGGGGGGSTGNVVVTNSTNSPVPVQGVGTQAVSINSPVPVQAGNIAQAPVTLSTACGTPTTPTSCASTSYALFNLGPGASDYSYQVNTINGATLAFYNSNDGVNFYASNLTIAGASPSALAFATSTTVAGKFAGIGGTSQYVAIVATVAPTSAITVYPYLGSHASAVSIHAAVPLTIANLGSPAPYIPVAVNPNATPAPLNLDGQGNLLASLNALNATATAVPLKTTQSVAGGSQSGVLAAGICSGAVSTPYCASVNSAGQLAVQSPYSSAANQALAAASFQGSGCVATSAPGSLTGTTFNPCFMDLSGNNYVNVAADSTGNLTAPGTSATNAHAMQGVTGGLPLGVGSGPYTATVGNLAAVSAAATATLGTATSALVSWNGTFVGSTINEGSDDGGTTWYPILCEYIGGGSLIGGTQALTNPSTAYVCARPGLTNIRTRLSAYTSGTLVVRITPSNFTSLGTVYVYPPSNGTALNVVTTNASGLVTTVLSSTTLAASTNSTASVTQGFPKNLTFFVNATTTATGTITIQESPDNTNFYTLPTTITLVNGANSAIVTIPGAKYVRFSSSVALTALTQQLQAAF